MKRIFAGSVCLALCMGALFYALSSGRSAPALGMRGDTATGVAAIALIFACTSAFVALIAWRDGRRQTMRINLNPGTSAETLRLGVKAGVCGLDPGASYRVIREIKDHYGNIFPVGMELTFVERNFLPYHGGHTVVFRPRTMYLQEEDNYDVINQFRHLPPSDRTSKDGRILRILDGVLSGSSSSGRQRRRLHRAARPRDMDQAWFYVPGSRSIPVSGWLFVAAR